jgi:hypothetical protein
MCTAYISQWAKRIERSFSKSKAVWTARKEREHSNLFHDLNGQREKRGKPGIVRRLKAWGNAQQKSEAFSRPKRSIAYGGYGKVAVHLNYRNLTNVGAYNSAVDQNAQI